MDEQKKLAAEVGDSDIVRYFYLDQPTQVVADKLNAVRLELSSKQDDVPFNAQVKSYFGALDQDGDLWIVKPVASDQEMLYHRACELAYLLDHRTGTFAAPTTALLIKGKRFRATKVVQHAVQISSYNYLEPPFINILRADLINRWIFFDEDRNPNNYLVITNKKRQPFVVAIDYDKADILSTSMKITGMPDKFGWMRSEKTRFLTLLKPENFDAVSIDAFEGRLMAFGSITLKELSSLAITALGAYCPDPEDFAASVAANLLSRRDYVDAYFRRMFKSSDETRKSCHDEDYSAFGQSFMDIHNRKKG